MKKKDLSTQEWLPFYEILENGIVKMKDASYVKIMKVDPINFNLKSNLEKEAILNSYQLFLKTCSFDFQILIQSKKEDLSNIISNVNQQIKKENNILFSKLAKDYISYIQKSNIEKKSSSKNFYILIKNSQIENQEKFESILLDELNEKFFKIKECLSRCGNVVYEYNQQEVKEIIFSFLNNRIYFNHY